MNLQRLDKMLGNTYGWDKTKTKVIVTFLEEVTTDMKDAAKAIVETHGWNVVEVKVEPKPCTGFAFAIEYINPADAPKRLPGHIYA